MSHLDFDSFVVVRVRPSPLSPDHFGVQCRWCEEVFELAQGDELTQVCLDLLEHVCDLGDADRSDRA
jgi:hypothetical protein